MFVETFYSEDEMNEIYLQRIFVTQLDSKYGAKR